MTTSDRDLPTRVVTEVTDIRGVRWPGPIVTAVPTMILSPPAEPEVADEGTDPVGFETTELLVSTSIPPRYWPSPTAVGTLIEKGTEVELFGGTFTVTGSPSTQHDTFRQGLAAVTVE